MDNGMALRATIIIDPNGVVQHASYNADLLGRSVAETLRLVQAVQTGRALPRRVEAGREDAGQAGASKPAGPKLPSAPRTVYRAVLGRDDAPLDSTSRDVGPRAAAAARDAGRLRGGGLRPAARTRGSRSC